MQIACACRFGFDGLVDAHAPLLTDAALRHGVGECRPVGERLRYRPRLGKQCLRLAKPVVEVVIFTCQPILRPNGFLSNDS
jgi:hypothetical protein